MYELFLTRIVLRKVLREGFFFFFFFFFEGIGRLYNVIGQYEWTGSLAAKTEFSWSLWVCVLSFSHDEFKKATDD